jgi:hypothetical protein
MTYVDRFAKWLSDPYNQILAITYATAVVQAVAAETGWRWAHVLSNVLAALPGVSVKGLATAARNVPKPLVAEKKEA